MKGKRLGTQLLIPFLAAAVLAGLNLVEFYQGAERRVYDLLLHLKPSAPEERSLLFLDIDDTSIAQVGQFPWSRDIMADGLVLLREFDAGYAVFDIEYVDPSPRGVNLRLLNQEIPEVFGAEFKGLTQNIQNLFLALKSGSISMRDAEDYVRDLTGLADDSRDKLLSKVREIARDNDTYLGQAARLFGRSFFTATLLPGPAEKPNPELESFALQAVPLPKVQLAEGFSPPASIRAQGVRPAILPVLKGARGAGFPNVIVDGDGVRRRVDLVMEYQGRYFAQLAFRPLLDWLGEPTVQIDRGALTLRQAQLPGGESRDIRIPLDPRMKLMINWPAKSYLESFRHLSYYTLVLHERLETDLLHNLKIMEEAGYLSYFKGNFGLLQPYQYAEGILQEVLAGGDPALMADYAQARAVFFDEAVKFLTGTAEAEILGQIDALADSEETDDRERAGYRELGAEVPGVFAATREVAQGLARVRATLREFLPGSFCVIGWTGTSTTDIGVNPFEEEYMNVGTHAAVVNTILSGRFLDELPWWYGAALALVLALGVAFAVRSLTPLGSILVGAGFLVAILAGGVVLFLFTGIYVNLVTPFLAVFISLVVLILLKFLALEKEKSFIRNAFAHYLSNDVINELVSDPDKLNLGGERKYLTAMFTDVRGFSTISEQLDPTDLVKLLNTYLEEMSNIILDQRGTIDKYEGDAIIAFFGAPVPLEDHAARACRSAVHMKKMERILNEHILREKLSAVPLVTRIGVNTGEMVVGNMGTQKRMDYTIMGNSVNLAARLEGVNKQYGTWILISEETYKTAGTEFAVRPMDRVRVVGISQPVRLYELVDEKKALDAKTAEGMELFRGGMDLFDQKRWAEAAVQFQQVLKVLPGDGPAETFLKRCQEFRQKPPVDNWDGVYNLSTK
jgi:adenylate cyclase